MWRRYLTATLALVCGYSIACANTTVIPRHAPGVQAFFASLEHNTAFVPNILELDPYELNMRIAQMSSSVERIISLLAFQPRPESYRLIKRFFDMYSILTGKTIDFTHLKKTDPQLIKRHELIYLRKQIRAFTDEMERTMMFVPRNDDLSLQMGYDMMVVNTYFRQLFVPVAFPQASALERWLFNISHNPSTQKKLLNAGIITGLAVGCYALFAAYQTEKKKAVTAKRKPRVIEVPVPVVSELNKQEQAFISELAPTPHEARAKLLTFINSQYYYQPQESHTNKSTSDLIRIAQFLCSFAQDHDHEVDALIHKHFSTVSSHLHIETDGEDDDSEELFGGPPAAPLETPPPAAYGFSTPQHGKLRSPNSSSNTRQPYSDDPPARHHSAYPLNKPIHPAIHRLRRQK